MQKAPCQLVYWIAKGSAFTLKRTRQHTLFSLLFSFLLFSSRVRSRGGQPQSQIRAQLNELHQDAEFNANPIWSLSKSFIQLSKREVTGPTILAKLGIFVYSLMCVYSCICTLYGSPGKDLLEEFSHCRDSNLLPPQALHPGKTGNLSPLGYPPPTTC